MNIRNKEDIRQFVEKMTLEEKVGQCMVIGFVGTVLTPMIMERIKRIHPAGVRCNVNMRMKDANMDPYAYNEERLDRVLRTPEKTVKDFAKGYQAPRATNEEYCHMLNDMKRQSMLHGAGIPLHITLDMEGDASCCYQSGDTRYFPSAMGMTLSGDEHLSYDVGWAVAKQVSGVGFSWIHSPVADVNTNPLNPEIGTRSFGNTAKEAMPGLLNHYKGLKDGGLITTAKHFPGRGASVSDAHKSLPVIDATKEEMKEHLATFQALIDAGVPSVMTAHTAYPALDPSGLPATLSKTILTDLLKGEMGFEGAITTDDITMGGIVERYDVHEACIMAINAGADLVLFRDESCLIDEVFPKIVEAAREGVITKERLNDAVTRTLTVKLEYGLFEDGGIKNPLEASVAIQSQAVREIAKEAAIKTSFIHRNKKNLVPLDRSKRILLIEQVHPLHATTNTLDCHPSLLWEKMLKHHDQVECVEVSLHIDEDDRKRIEKRMESADIIVATNYYHRRNANGTAYINGLASGNKPVVIVTNCPYEFTISDDYDTILMCYGGSPESMESVAKILFE